jgi:hypothetical protein
MTGCVRRRGRLGRGLETLSASNGYATQNNVRILLANVLQSSRSTFSWGSFLSLCAFKAGMMDTQISTLGGSPTVIHEPGLSTAYKNGELFSGESPMSLALTTTHENDYFQRSIGWVFETRRKVISSFG